MTWSLCLKEHIKNVSQNKERARSLLKMAMLRYEFWSKVKLEPKYTSIVIDGLYEVIKELLTALLFLEGYKSDNHECLIAYLKKHFPEYSYEVAVIYQLKKVRNEINYRGFFVKPDYLLRNKLEFKHIIKMLQKVIKEKL